MVTHSVCSSLSHRLEEYNLTEVKTLEIELIQSLLLVTSWGLLTVLSALDRYQLKSVFPLLGSVHSPQSSSIVQTHASSTSIPHCGLLTKDCPGPILLNFSVRIGTGFPYTTWHGCWHGCWKLVRLVFRLKGFISSEALVGHRLTFLVGVRLSA